jgi:phage-related protein
VTWRVHFHPLAQAELAEWPAELRAALGRIFDRIEALGLHAVAEPQVRPLGDKLWEMRPSGKKLEGRALYVARDGKRVVVVLAFIKKAKKTPARMIDTALRRAKEVS